MRVLHIILAIATLTITPQALKSQEVPIFISYFGHIGFQPGLKAGTELPIMGNPTRELENDIRKWVIKPQVGFFTNPGDDRNFLTNVEVGIKKPIANKNAYRTVSFGLGWLRQSKVNSFAVNLANGNTSDTQRTNYNYLMPTLNYEYGWATHRNTSWFSKLSLGRRMLGSGEDSMMLFLELGLRFSLKTKSE